jgi:phosphate regulon transcriptional regulator PhoB
MTREVLVVEDEPDIRRLVVLHLERDGFRCRTATTGPEALREVQKAAPDLVVLDLMLPDLDGLEVCRQLRGDRRTAAVPIIMLTAKSDEVDRIVGLEVGADDYVAKPFSPKELVARVRAVLRRVRSTDEPRVLSVGPVVLDPLRHGVSVDGRPVELTPKEFDLLQALLEAAGRVLSREHLLNHVWGYARADEIESRTVDVHVRRLRAKLGDAGHRIATVKSVGYRFETDSAC